MGKDSSQRPAEEALFAGEAWFDPIEAGLRDRIRGFIEELVEQELQAALGRALRAGRRGSRTSARASDAAADRLFRAGGDCRAAGPGCTPGTAPRANGAAPCCRATPG